MSKPVSCCIIVLSIVLVKCFNCPRGYNSQFNDSCYFYSHDVETWVGAIISCQILDGKIVEIESQPEFDFLASKSRENGDVSRWVGLSDKLTKGDWVWSYSHASINTTNYSNWAPGEPDHFNGQADESCVMMDQPNQHSYKWADVKCDRLETYICETEAIPTQGGAILIGRRK